MKDRIKALTDEQLRTDIADCEKALLVTERKTLGETLAYKRYLVALREERDRRTLNPIRQVLL